MPGKGETTKTDLSEHGERFLIYATDFQAYHLSLVRSGIESYADRNLSEKLVYLHTDIVEVRRLFGNSILDRLCVIGTLKSSENIHFFQKHKIPLLNLIEGKNDSFIELRFDGEGTRAAQYFTEEANVAELGFIGFKNSPKDVRRLNEYKKTASAHGIPVKAFMLGKSHIGNPFADYDESILREYYDDYKGFIRSLKKPAGIFCNEDRMAFNLYYMAEKMGYSVPGELAILSIGTKSRSKELWARSISMLQMDHVHLGFSAAKAMDLFIQGKELPEFIHISPSDIYHGQTTGSTSVSDKLVQEAIHFVQENPSTTVVDICDHFNVSRREMDTRFVTATSLTVVKMIEVERFNRAKNLVKASSYTLDEIASLVGYPTRRAMRRSFQRFTRITPQQFRELY